LSTLDLNSGKGKIEWKSDESGAEEASRLKKEEGQHQHDLRVSWWTFVAYVAALFIVGIVGLLLIFIGGTPERERTGVVFLTAIISGAVGYLSGKKGK